MEKSAMVVVLVACMVALAAAQGGGAAPPTCGTKLAPCFQYLNATTPPPKECCDPLKQAVTNEKDCLCNIYNNPSLIKVFNINVTQALNLITRCHVDSVKDPNTFCKAAAPAMSPSSSPTGSTPSASGNSTAGSPPAGSAAKMPGAGLAGLISIALALGSYSMFY